MSPPRTIRLSDYTPPPFLIDSVDLDVSLWDDHAVVCAQLSVRRNPRAADPGAPLLLDGEDLGLQSVSLDGRPLNAGEFTVDDEALIVERVPEAFVLETRSRIEPQTNTRLMGLYLSKNGYFTQCEAEGFRRITWFLDRPDVMSRYTVTIHADRQRCPVLLSNGNRVASGDDGDGRHWARWHDPFPKPCYLFALVAARLDEVEDSFVTRSGKRASLHIFVEPGRREDCSFAMACLKNAMRWDEDVYGLELDLDQYMIVAVDDFNMGAMENKGLNIFNTKYIFARPALATDADYMGIDRVIAHEYFHNWTGNRVTCRDWFQLSLKEGLTVFRDQEYGADTYSRAVQRIREVRGLRAAQFPEDAGPMAHPVRPQSYVEINNFYTSTVYSKGAEVVRMIHTLLGADGFRRGMDLYFARHDGQAVTTDDFVQAMQDASGVDLGPFKRWYDQAGTPRLAVAGRYDAPTQTYTLTVRQSCPPTPGLPPPLPFHIPLAIGLIGADGGEVPLHLAGDNLPAAGSRLLSLRAPVETFQFREVPTPPVPSLLRGFSAPVIVDFPYDEAALIHLLAHDTDPFSRWEAGQRLATGLALQAIDAAAAGRAMAFPETLADAFARVLADSEDDPAFAAEALTLPSELFIAEQLAVVDPDAVQAAHLALQRFLASRLAAPLAATYEAMAAATAGPYRPDAAAAGRRALKSVCLGYLMEGDESAGRDLCRRQFETAANMTDTLAALSLLANTDAADGALAAFYAQWKDEPLAVDKWLGVQARSRRADTLARVRALSAHPAFDRRNPNKVYALLGGFGANQRRFHAADGEGYAFLADEILAIDGANPLVAARLARAFDRFKRFDEGRQAHARTALERILAAPGLSKDTAEVAGRALA